MWNLYFQWKSHTSVQMVAINLKGENRTNYGLWSYTVIWSSLKYNNETLRFNFWVLTKFLFFPLGSYWEYTARKKIALPLFSLVVGRGTFWYLSKKILAYSNNTFWHIKYWSRFHRNNTSHSINKPMWVWRDNKDTSLTQLYVD